jgi:hypothetical protein
MPGWSRSVWKSVRRGAAWVLIFPLALIWIVFRVLGIPIYWALVIIPLPVVHFTRWGEDGTWERWAEVVSSAFDSPLRLAGWIGGEGWAE